jgi:hypothetical protein
LLIPHSSRAGDFALYYYTFTDASTAMAYRSLTPAEAAIR